MKQARKLRGYSYLTMNRSAAWRPIGSHATKRGAAEQVPFE